MSWVELVIVSLSDRYQEYNYAHMHNIINFKQNKSHTGLGVCDLLRELGISVFDTELSFHQTSIITRVSKICMQ